MEDLEKDDDRNDDDDDDDDDDDATAAADVAVFNDVIDVAGSRTDEGEEEGEEE